MPSIRIEERECYFQAIFWENVLKESNLLVKKNFQLNAYFSFMQMWPKQGTNQLLKEPTNVLESLDF